MAVTLLSIFASNAIAVPLAPAFPASELRYILRHSGALGLLSTTKYEQLARQVLSEDLVHPPIYAHIEKTVKSSTSLAPSRPADDAQLRKGGMLLYTSGTTARPKGVLLHHDVLNAQATSLLQAWDYSARDRLLHVLPLHHIHGTVNALITPLLAGSSVEMMYPFNVDQVWRRLAAPFLRDDSTNKPPAVPVSFFTVVPTIWSRLLASHPHLSPDLRQATTVAIQRRHLRLNISGSAALPTPTKQAWSALSDGNVLLERFGMTEVGMALSCGLQNCDRIDGSVGWPLPSVEARLVDPDSGKLIDKGDEVDMNGKERPGEVQLRGPTVFRGYWRDPEATAKEFTPDGWFKTGDIAVRRHVPGAGAGTSGEWARGPAYFIHGRKSADIIKTGGEKVSALEIERELLSLGEVQECAVVGLPSVSWGQKVAAVVVLTEVGQTAGKDGRPWGAMDMRRALKSRLVAYKIPQDMKVVDVIPRNAMGKVNKKQLIVEVFGDGKAIRRRSEETMEERAKEKAKASNGT